MALTIKQRQWFLGLALALTLTAVATMENQEEVDSEVVQPKHLKSNSLQKDKPASNAQVGEWTLAKLNRQRLPENERNMFASKSWFVPSPPPKAAVPTAPPLPFVYIGKLAEEGQKVIIILSKQNRSYQVREGDVLDNIYRVDEVRPPVLTLTYLPLDIKQTIPIGVSN